MYKLYIPQTGIKINTFELIPLNNFTKGNNFYSYLKASIGFNSEALNAG